MEKKNKNIKEYYFGEGSIGVLTDLLDKQIGFKVILIDTFFRNNIKLLRFDINRNDIYFHFVNSNNELTTNYVDVIVEEIRSFMPEPPIVVVGIGGGTTLDTAKAVANLLTNPGLAEDYQGWDLVRNPAIYKIGVPTLSGTGAETSRTCVMINHKTGLKLGMNSEHSIFDTLILDPLLSKTVPRYQYLYTGMDTYIHSIESLNGHFRHSISDALSQEAISICREVFLNGDMMKDENREKMMVASYLGGTAIANTFVGVVHPFSAGLSVVFGLPHCVANCVAMRGMEEFYPKEFDEFWRIVELQHVIIPSHICLDINLNDQEKLYNATMIHEKPLRNALGDNYKEKLTFDKVCQIFEKM